MDCERGFSLCYFGVSRGEKDACLLKFPIRSYSEMQQSLLYGLEPLAHIAFNFFFIVLSFIFGGAMSASHDLMISMAMLDGF